MYSAAAEQSPLTPTKDAAFSMNHSCPLAVCEVVQSYSQNGLSVGFINKGLGLSVV